MKRSICIKKQHHHKNGLDKLKSTKLYRRVFCGYKHLIFNNKLLHETASNELAVHFFASFKICKLFNFYTFYHVD